MTRLVIVRHGNTFEAGETPRRIGARTDLPLTAAGLEQAEALGRHFCAQWHPLRPGAVERTAAHADDRPQLSWATRDRIEPASFLTEVDHGPG